VWTLVRDVVTLAPIDASRRAPAAGRESAAMADVELDEVAATGATNAAR